MKTYQDLQATSDLPTFIMTAIREHKASMMYHIAADAEEYDRQRNVTIMKYQKVLYTLTGQAVPDTFTANHKIASNFFNRFVTQENQYLLGNGMDLKREANKTKLGKDFDLRLQQAGRAALVQGVSFGFWNFDRLEVFKLTEFVPLRDEDTGALMAGIRFWQVDYDKPLRATLYEIDGYTEYIKRPKDPKLAVHQPKRSYKRIITQSAADGVQITDGGNYSGFPIVPLWGNPLHQSELVGLREGIDCYDLIKSGFANDLDDASLIYWTLENSGGMDDVDLAQFVERMKTVHAAPADAEAHTVDVPYQGRTAYLERLEQDLYNDAQIVNVSSLSAAQKTATEIRAAYTPMDLKVDQYEYCILEFLQGIFALAGIVDEPTFTRNRIHNELEETQMVLMAAQYLDDETLLKKLPWLTPEEAQTVLDRRDESETQRFSGTAEPAPDEEQEHPPEVNTDGEEIGT